MHDWAVAVPFDVGIAALMRSTPGYAAHLPTWQHPVGITVENFPKPWYELGVDQIDEGVSHASLCTEIDGQIEKVVQTSKTFCVDHA